MEGLLFIPEYAAADIPWLSGVVSILLHYGGVFLMEKNKKSCWNVKTLVFMALLVAMHLVLTRVFVIELGAYRISVGSVCTILAGLWLGPVAGGVCGLASDIIGCFMKGYAINPLITIAAIFVGRNTGADEIVVGRKNKNCENGGNERFHFYYCNFQLSYLYNCRAGDIHGI